MLSWIGANIGNIVICAVLILTVAAIVVHMVKEKKKGISPICGGKCGHCPMNCGCRGSDSKSE
ncbi:MAG: FeoB-associated Cys-rich membrane protein [Ruminococcus sp.]|nr:FeoB-associated Cys-rich membrane protein [Ruminococcus sp.]